MIQHKMILFICVFIFASVNKIVSFDVIINRNVNGDTLFGFNEERGCPSGSHRVSDSCKCNVSSPTFHKFANQTYGCYPSYSIKKECFNTNVTDAQLPIITFHQVKTHLVGALDQKIEPNPFANCHQLDQTGKTSVWKENNYQDFNAVISYNHNPGHITLLVHETTFSNISGRIIWMNLFCKKQYKNCLLLKLSGPTNVTLPDIVNPTVTTFSSFSSILPSTALKSTIIKTVAVPENTTTVRKATFTKFTQILQNSTKFTSHPSAIVIPSTTLTPSRSTFALTKFQNITHATMVTKVPEITRNVSSLSMFPSITVGMNTIVVETTNLVIQTNIIENHFKTTLVDKATTQTSATVAVSRRSTITFTTNSTKHLVTVPYSFSASSSEITSTSLAKTEDVTSSSFISMSAFTTTKRTVNITTTSSQSESKSNKNTLMIGIGVAAVVLLILLVISFTICRRHFKSKFSRNKLVSSTASVAATEMVYEYTSAGLARAENVGRDKNESNSTQISGEPSNQYASLTFENRPIESYGTLQRKNMAKVAETSITEPMYFETEPIYSEAGPNDEYSVYQAENRLPAHTRVTRIKSIDDIATPPKETVLQEPVYFETVGDVYAEVNKH